MPVQPYYGLIMLLIDVPTWDFSVKPEKWSLLHRCHKNAANICEHCGIVHSFRLSFIKNTQKTATLDFPRSSDSRWIIVKASWLNSFSVLRGCPSPWYEWGRHKPRTCFNIFGLFTVFVCLFICLFVCLFDKMSDSDFYYPEGFSDAELLKQTLTFI